MDRAEAADLLQRHFGRPVPARLTDQLVRRTGGDSQWLTAILDQLDPESDGLYRVPLDFPPELAGPLVARLEALSPQARAVLEAAAVLGREFDLALLERMTSDVDVLDGLAEAQQARLIKALPAQVFLFVSAPARELCYDAIGAKQRAGLHDRAAAALAALGAMGGARAATIAELAHHTHEAAALGGSTRLDAAAAASVSAGAAAAEAGAHDLSAEYFAQAATMAGRSGWPPQASGRLLVAAGEARLRSSRSAQQRDVGRASLTGALRMGSRAPDAGLIAAAALGFGPRVTLGPLAVSLSALAAPGRSPLAPRSDETARGAAERLDGRGGVERHGGSDGRDGGKQEWLGAAAGGVRMLAVLAPADEARREALRTALEAGPQETSLVSRLRSRLALETVDRALAQEALRSATECGDPRAHAEALLTLAALADISKDAAGHEWLQQAAREAEALHDRDLIARASDLMATAATRAGQSAAALEYLVVQATLNGPGATAFGRWFGLRAVAEAALLRGQAVPGDLLEQISAAGQAVDPVASAEYALVLRNPPEQPKHAGLTVREREILVWALRGAPAREIATALTVAERTVETHLASIYRKLGVRTRVELITKMTMKES